VLIVILYSNVRGELMDQVSEIRTMSMYHHGERGAQGDSRGCMGGFSSVQME